MHRSEYIDVTFRNGRQMTALHRKYYAQYVTDYVRGLVASRIGLEAIKNSKNEHFNDIPLPKWDALVPHLGASKALISNGDWLSLSTGVCIAKEAARQIKEGNK